MENAPNCRVDTYTYEENYSATTPTDKCVNINDV